MIQPSISITSLPSPVLQEIFSYCAANPRIPKVCRHFYAIYQRTMSNIGKDLISKIDRTVWCPAHLPAPNTLTSDEQGLEFVYNVLKKAKQVWMSFDLSIQRQFPKLSFQHLCFDADLLNKLLAAELITLFEHNIPRTLLNSTLKEKMNFLLTGIIKLELTNKRL